MFPDKNTQFIITKKSDNKSFKIYWDTLTLRNDTLYGLRSRIMKVLKIVPVINVAKIEVYGEFHKTIKVK